MTDDAPLNPKAYEGVKKVALGLIPPVFKVKLALALQYGARKYGPHNWLWPRQKPIRLSTYINAMQRHLDAFASGENLASDSGVEHLAHLAASCAIVIEAIEAGVFEDDRRPSFDLQNVLDEAAALIASWPESKYPEQV